MGCPQNRTENGTDVPEGKTLACSSTCRTKNCESYGACLRAKSLQVADVGAHIFHKRQNSEIDAYVDARKAGIQPKTVWKKDVEAAWKATDATGVPFRADQ